MKRCFQVTVNGETYRVEVVEVIEELGKGDPTSIPAPKPPLLRPAPKPRREGKVVTAPLPGMVVEVRAEPGRWVRKGETLVVIDAMKMENEITAPHEGVVEEVLVKDGETVNAGQALVKLS